MPLVQISLVRGKSREYLDAISLGIHSALVDAFEIPEDDRFQLIHQLDPADLIYDRSYLGIERTDDIVVICITAGNWRDNAKKRKLYAAIAENLAGSPGLRKEDVQVVLSLNERDEWSFGLGRQSYE